MKPAAVDVITILIIMHMSISSSVLTKGQVLTKYYRWMNKNGGWVWMQTKASLIPHPTNPELKQMLCLNYIVRLAFVYRKLPQILNCLVVLTDYLTIRQQT